MPTSSAQKPVRLYFKSYLQAIKNSVDSNMFRNFYVKTADKGEFDALDDGENSCAFYVSSVLTTFKKIDSVHGTVDRTVEEMKKSGWAVVKQPKPGDVLVWEPKDFKDGPHKHIGFYVGDGKAISTSSSKRTPVEHDKNFGKSNRKIAHIFRMLDWDDKP